MAGQCDEMCLNTKDRNQTLESLNTYILSNTLQKELTHAALGWAFLLLTPPPTPSDFPRIAQTAARSSAVFFINVFIYVFIGQSSHRPEPTYGCSQVATNIYTYNAGYKEKGQG